jgi:hypothetical protein
MIFFVDNVIADPELGLLADLYEFLDSKLEKLCDESVLCNDAESSGYYDQIEYLTGFGLIALQTYLTETWTSPAFVDIFQLPVCSFSNAIGLS